MAVMGARAGHATPRRRSRWPSARAVRASRGASHRLPRPAAAKALGGQGAAARILVATQGRRSARTTHHPPRRTRDHREELGLRDFLWSGQPRRAPDEITAGIVVAAMRHDLLDELLGIWSQKPLRVPRNMRPSAD